MNLIVDLDFCSTSPSPCDPRMACADLSPPADPYSEYYSITNCSDCPVGTRASHQVVYFLNGVVENPVTCIGEFGLLWASLGLWIQDNIVEIV